MTLRLNGDSSGFTEIKAPNFAGDNSITLPTGNGSAFQLLKNSGTAGELEYTGNLEHTTTGALLLAAPSVRNNFFKTFSSKFQIEGIGGTGLNRAGIAVVENCTTGDPAYSILARSHGPGVGSNTLVANGAWVGVHSFQANDGTKFIETAAIRSYTAGATGTDVMPGRLTFATNGGGQDVTDRIEIAADGALRILSNCPGIDFSQKQGAANNGTMTSEVLDCYEEGHFTPVLCGGGNAGTWSPSAGNGGYYTKIGNMVFASINCVGNLAGASGQPRVKDLPFISVTNAGAGNNASYSTGSLQYWDGSGADFMGPLNYPNSTYIYFHAYDGDSSGAPAIVNGNHNLHCSLVYRAAV